MVDVAVKLDGKLSSRDRFSGSASLDERIVLCLFALPLPVSATLAPSILSPATIVRDDAATVKRPNHDPGSPRLWRHPPPHYLTALDPDRSTSTSCPCSIDHPPRSLAARRFGQTPPSPCRPVVLSSCRPLTGFVFSLGLFLSPTLSSAMSFFFGRGRSRTNAAELARQTYDLLVRLDLPRNPSPKLDDSLPKCLAQMKAILQGSPEVDSSPEQVYQLVQGIIDEQVLLLLPQALRLLPFESRKDAQVVFSSVFRYRPPGTPPTDPPLAVSFVTHRAPSVLVALCHGYDHKESATTAGSILREVLKHEAAAAVVLYDDVEAISADEAAATPEQQQQQQQLQDGSGMPLPAPPPQQPRPAVGSSAGGVSQIAMLRLQSGRGVFWQFFRWIDTSSFEVAADAFTTFRELLTRHKELVPQYLSVNFDLFFGRYNTTLVLSQSYVTKRQSIKLLGEILLDRSNYSVMTRYVDSGEHLKICMNLLRDDRKMVQYEGFHVFKIFVANPNKSIAVQKILIMNRDKLLNFLSHFLEERTEDEQFLDEREFLIKQIRNMPPKPRRCRRSAERGCLSSIALCTLSVALFSCLSISLFP
ncbi:conidiophore development protein hyma [Grosmannia clavigera kw1407]|uniref:Conidiophore development protein hyma n=1 Tax=Grosmannia clavigera (strain kw1407 / UAMH 11150) TaxID=655863 RepID=F0XA34_GROCL|nr:conidiophore development protein hyma [Grosmannia clavigera kw1407]EFX06079.1 conidiophore development protein hyma [Grosmannia clavigera kw1407]